MARILKKFSLEKHAIEVVDDHVNKKQTRSGQKSNSVTFKTNLQQVDKKKKQKETLRELSSFSYLTSHDLQEPLRKIQTFSSRLLEKEAKNLSEEGADNLRRLNRSAQRMQMLMKDLSTYTKISESRVSTSDFTNVDLKETVTKVIHDLELMIFEKDAKVDYEGPTGVCAIQDHIYILLYNILSNALKFNHEERKPVIKMRSHIVKGDKIKLENITASRKYLHLKITDNGIGFDPQFNERIFEIFQRLHDKEKFDGTGIGLALCKRIAEIHKGAITAKGTPNEGTEVNIYLPLR